VELNVNRLTALIDGDILVYRCGFAAEKTHYCTTDKATYQLFDAHKDIPKDTPKHHIWSRKEVEPVENALAGVDASIEYILRNTGATDYEIYLSGKRSFREEIAVTRPYKGNRDGIAKPVHYTAIRGHLVSRHGARVSDGDLEADDFLGIRLTALGSSGVCVSIDKDLLQIPGRHYNWVTGEHELVDARGGHLALGYQIISGDPTDNVPGLAGFGEAKARKVLTGCPNPQDMLDRIRTLYLDQFRGDVQASKRYFEEQGSLVYILKTPDDSFKKYLEKYSNAT
jgi:DNA polymerase I